MLHKLLLVVLAGVVTPAATVALPAVALPSCQDKAELRKQLEERLAQADPKDVDAVFAVALWAERKGLKSDARKVLRRVIALDKDHAEARKALGYVQYQGKWVKAADVAKLEKKAAAAKAKREAAEYRKKGYVLHEGAWVKKSDLVYAKLGLVQKDGTWMRQSDKEALDQGKVQHPETGRWMDAEHAAKAKEGHYQLGEEWGTLSRANAYHTSWDSPWQFYTKNVILETTMPFKMGAQLARDAETAVTYARNILFDPTLPLPRRVRVRVFGNLDDYKEFGDAVDETGFSSYGCFWAAEADDKPVAVNYADKKDWGPYYLKHAVGLGACASLMEAQGIAPTHWLLTGVGSYTERWSNATAAAYFGKQYLQKGGVKRMKSFAERFRLSGDQSLADMNWNVYQAGIVVSYVATRPDKKTRKAWDGIRAAIMNGKGLAKAIKTFEKQMVRVEQNIRDHLKRLVSQG